MTARPRPGLAITEDERLIALLGKAVDALVFLQTLDPRPEVEDVIHQIRFVHRQLVQRLPEGLGYGAQVEQ